MASERGSTQFEYLRAIEPASKTRVEALADGIFAVAMTLLVLDIRLPPLPTDISAAQYTHALFGLWPKVIVFVCSFITIGRCWQLHRMIFHLITRCDQQMVFWTLQCLMVICLLPFTTSLVGDRPYYSVSAVVYASNMLLTHMVYRGAWLHATRGPGLLQSDLDPAIRTAIRQMFNVHLVLVMVALVLSFFNSITSIWLIVLYQVIMFFGPHLTKALPGAFPVRSKVTMTVGASTTNRSAESGRS